MISNIRKILREGVDKTIKCNKCGWHWKQSESSEDELYKCHKCGHDNKPDLNEHLQQADKIFFKTGKLPIELRDVILSITNGDAYTRLVADLIYHFNNFNNHPSNIQVGRHFYKQLKNYNKNIFPVKGELDSYSSDNDGNCHIIDLFGMLSNRELLVNRFKELPSIAIRNLKSITKIPFDNDYEFSILHDKVVKLNSILKSIPNNNPLGKEVLNKIYSSNNTLDDMIEIGEHYQHSFSMGGKENKKKLLNDIKSLNVNIIQNSNNILVLKVNDNDSMIRVGCTSLWCFSRPNSDGFWEDYATYGFVYVIFNFNQSHNHATFLMTLLPDTGTIYTSTNVPLEEIGIDDAWGYIKSIGVDTSKLNHKSNTDYYLDDDDDDDDDNESKQVTKSTNKSRPYVDPNQLSLFESLRTKVLKEERLLAPNGNPSNLPPHLYTLVRTPEFKNWFGDWENNPNSASKVVDDNGEPLVCYHQTSAENKKSILDSGLFLDGKERAAKYDYTTPYGFFFKNHERNIGLGDSHLPVFLNIRNPLYATNRESLENLVIALSNDYFETIKQINNVDTKYNKLTDVNNDKELHNLLIKFREDKTNLANKAAIDAYSDKINGLIKIWGDEINKLALIAKKQLDIAIKKESYDGVLIRYDAGSWGRETDTKIAFNQNQIKSADGSNKTFSSKPDLRNETYVTKFLKNKLLKEYISQNMVSLKRYFSMTDDEKKLSLPEMYWWFFDDFLIEYDIDFEKPKDSIDVEGNDVGDELEGLDLVEWVSRNNPELINQFADYLFERINNNTLNISDADYPAWSFYSTPEVIKNQWLIHFTNDADSIARQGFTRGVDEMDKLGLTCHLGEFDKKYGGYNFAYTIHDYQKYASNRHGFKYGNEAVIFNASGIKVWHYGDEEPQVIFYGNTARNIISITNGENSDWSIRDKKTNRIIFENDNFDKVVKWVVNNYIQYKNKI